MINPDTIRCEDLDRSLDDYLAGVLPERDAAALETHAASCARCEARLEAATRRPVEFSPALPATLREDTLRAVASARAASRPYAARSVRSPWTWVGGVTTLAAAAALVIVTRGGVSDGPNRTDSARSPVAATTPDSIRVVAPPAQRPARVDSVRTPVVASAPDSDVPIRERIAARLADEESRSEFAALDVAAQELEAALAAAPSDSELRAYLSSVRARRDELARRVKAATS